MKVFLFVCVAFVIDGLSAAVSADLASNDLARSSDRASNLWSGFYLGGSLGGAWSRSTSRTGVTLGSADSYFFDSSISVINDVGTQRVAESGFMGGSQGGYAWQRGVWVVGLEADIDYQPVARQSTGTAIYPCCSPTGFSISRRIRSNWLATARPLVGVTHGRLLYFLAGGATVANIRSGFSFADNNSHAAASGSDSHTVIGHSLGGGIEARLSGHWTMRVDYVFVSLRKVSGSSANLSSDFGPSPTNIFQYSADLRENIARLGVNFRF